MWFSRCAEPSEIRPYPRVCRRARTTTSAANVPANDPRTVLAVASAAAITPRFVVAEASLSRLTVGLFARGEWNKEPLPGRRTFECKAMRFLEALR